MCPLCGRSGRRRDKWRLYQAHVCRKCYYSFANRRQLAYIVDALLWWPISLIVLMGLEEIMSVTGAFDAGTISMASMSVSWLVLPLIFSLKDGFGGKSPGKALCGVRVVDRETFQPIGHGASLKRNLVLIVPFMPLIVAVFLSRGYRLGDGWARTKVIWKKHAGHPLFLGELVCDRCSYDLTGNTTGVCPECGAVRSNRGGLVAAPATQPAAPTRP